MASKREDDRGRPDLTAVPRSPALVRSTVMVVTLASAACGRADGDGDGSAGDTIPPMADPSTTEADIPPMHNPTTGMESTTADDADTVAPMPDPSATDTDSASASGTGTDTDTDTDTDTTGSTGDDGETTNVPPMPNPTE
jgi:hypothetical protein